MSGRLTDITSTRPAPGAPAVLILTRWHHEHPAARILDRDADAGWELLNIPAQPDRGEAAHRAALDALVDGDG